MSATKQPGLKRYGVLYGPEFMFVNAASEADALEAGRIKLLRKAEDKLRGNQKAPADLLDRHLFSTIAKVHPSTRD